MSTPARSGGDSDAPDPRNSLIEDFGLHIGRAMGWPPMAGRAAGVLMLSDEPLTLADLQAALGASKGSVSEVTRLLITSGTVERYKPTGGRHFVLHWRDDAWIGCLRHQLEQMTHLLAFAEHAHERGSHFSATQRRRLRDMLDYYRFMVDHLETLLSDYTDREQLSRPVDEG